MVLLVAFQPDQIRVEDRQPKRPAPRQGVFRVSNTTAIACQAVCQPVIRLMQHKGQALRVGHLNQLHTVKQFAQRGQGE